MLFLKILEYVYRVYVLGILLKVYKIDNRYGIWFLNYFRRR